MLAHGRVSEAGKHALVVQGIVWLMDMGNTDEAFRHFGSALDTGKKAFELWKSLQGASSTPQKEAEVEKLFADAETERQLALASIGKAFRYQLCRCTLPPQVCLRTGFDKSTGYEQSKCPNCGHEYPEEVDPLPRDDEDWPRRI